MYKRQLISMLAMIALCLILLGAGFFSLFYRYHIEDTQKVVKRNLEYVAEYANQALRSEWDMNSQEFWAFLSLVSQVSGTTILLCQPDGQILLASEPGQTASPLAGKSIPTWAANAVLSDKQSYSGMTTFNGLFRTRHYTSGVPVLAYTVGVNPEGKLVGYEAVCGMLFIATDTSSILAFMTETMQIFLLTSLMVLLITLVIGSVVTQRQVQPVNEMAAAAYRFAHGETDARAADYAKRSDEIGELARAFNAMADSLAQSERQRSEFVANVSHELKTPMTTIAGFADGILDGTIPPEREREFLEIISSETRRLSRLVRRMLELSRLQSSERVAAQEQFDICEVLLRVLVSLEPKITEKALEVQTEFQHTPVMVWGEPDAVTQVCYNLLDNAIKFSTQGGELTLTIVTKGGKAYISVRNQGETISPEQLSHIFDRFHKADSSRSEHREGVGLGLYIVKTILNTYKEDITVTSENGLTEFTFTLSEV